MAFINLASTSKYRANLLSKLGIPFECSKPDTDETPLENETPEALVLRLGIAKAESIAQKITEEDLKSQNKLNAQYTPYLVVGSDQVAIIESKVLGKPGNFENAQQQLHLVSGKKILFLTSLCVINPLSQQIETLVEPYHVYFKTLTPEMIDRYLTSEQPYDCAGSFKSEGFGISLLQSLEGRDPNALIGLPLIGLIELLNRQGVECP